MKYLLIIMLSVLSSANALSEIAQEGKELYMEANCQKCHGIDAAYDAKKNLVKNEFDLNKWTSQCMSFFGHSWFPEEKDSVVRYLNEIKYNVKLQK